MRDAVVLMAGGCYFVVSLFCDFEEFVEEEADVSGTFDTNLDYALRSISRKSSSMSSSYLDWRAFGGGCR